MFILGSAPQQNPDSQMRLLLRICVNWSASWWTCAGDECGGRRTNHTGRQKSPVAEKCALFMVAPDNRRAKVAEQLQRPAFSRVSELGIRYLPYSQLEQNHASMSRFGSSIKPLLEISQRL